MEKSQAERFVEIWGEVRELLRQNNQQVDKPEQIKIAIALLREENDLKTTEIIGKQRERHDMSSYYAPATEKQKKYMAKLGIKFEKDIRSGEASQLINKAKKE